MLRRHAGWFWNAVLPLGLFGGLMIGAGMMVADLCWDGVLDKPIGWAGCGVLVSSWVAFTLIKHWLEGEDAGRERKDWLLDAREERKNA